MPGGSFRSLPLTRPEATELFRYDPETGCLFWLKKPSPASRSMPGALAGRMHSDGRWRISIRGQSYGRYRLVWLYHHGDPSEAEIDHANRDPADDRIENLRLASRSEQLVNRGLMGHNTCGHRSIYYDTSKRLWSVRVSIFGKRKRFGMYKTKEEAAAVATRVGREAYGEFWAD